MNQRAIILTAVLGLLGAVSLPAINRAQEPVKDSADEGENPFAGKLLEQRQEQLRKQEKQLHIQAEEMRMHARLAAKEAEKAAEKAQIKFRSVFRRPGNPRYMSEINEQAAKFRDAKSEEDKDIARNSLVEVIDKCFEDDMKVREKELKSIEERLQKLKAQLDRRRAKKQEIVDLQVKVAINEAEGLGFFGDAKGDMFKFRVPAPVITEFPAPWEATASWNANAPVPAAEPVPAAVPAPPATTGTIRIENRQMTAGPPVPTAAIKFEQSGDGELMVSPPVFDRRPLSLGAEGDLVRLLQFQLNARLDPSPNLDVDADFGPATEQAVKDFQKQEGLEVTGVVDEATRKELDRRN